MQHFLYDPYNTRAQSFIEDGEVAAALEGHPYGYVHPEGEHCRDWGWGELGVVKFDSQNNCCVRQARMV